MDEFDAEGDVEMSDADADVQASPEVSPDQEQTTSSTTSGTSHHARSRRKTKPPSSPLPTIQEGRESDDNSVGDVHSESDDDRPLTDLLKPPKKKAPT